MEAGRKDYKRSASLPVAFRCSCFPIRPGAALHSAGSWGTQMAYVSYVAPSKGDLSSNLDLTAHIFVMFVMPTSWAVLSFGYTRAPCVQCTRSCHRFASSFSNFEYLWRGMLAVQISLCLWDRLLPSWQP